jgi:hypothetical protein
MAVAGSGVAVRIELVTLGVSEVSTGVGGDVAMEQAVSKGVTASSRLEWFRLIFQSFPVRVSGA